MFARSDNVIFNFHVQMKTTIAPLETVCRITLGVSRTVFNNALLSLNGTRPLDRGDSIRPYKEFQFRFLVWRYASNQNHSINFRITRYDNSTFTIKVITNYVFYSFGWRTAYVFGSTKQLSVFLILLYICFKSKQ